MIELNENMSDREWDAHETYNDYRRNALYSLMEDLLNKKLKNPKQVFKLAPIARINKIWTDFSKTGLVRDEAGLKMIGEIFIENIAMLAINTELAGHGTSDPYYLVQEFNEKISRKQAEKILDSDRFTNYIEDYNGQLRISDYGLPKLEKLAWKYLAQDNTAEERLITLDMMLNVVHQRSDLSRLFVQGGSASLDNLFTNENTNKPLIKKLLREHLHLSK